MHDSIDIAKEYKSCLQYILDNLKFRSDPKSSCATDEQLIKYIEFTLSEYGLDIGIGIAKAIEKYINDKPFHIYKNSRKNMFSIRQNGKVIGHSKQLFLRDCTFVVNQSGRQKVLDTKVKNVHAYIKGTIILDPNVSNWTQVKYNPYKYSCFVSEKYKPVLKAKYCCLTIGPQEVLISE